MTTHKDDGHKVGGQKSSEGGRSNPHKASPAAVERYIKNISFPARKQDLINQAKKNEAPADVMEVINRFGDKTYNNPIDISKEVGKVA